MTKGTTSYGRRNRGITHVSCRRCGEHSYNVRKKFCSSCGYGKTAKMRIPSRPRRYRTQKS
jgi:large subunit ribosomal protein L37e